VGEKKSEEVGRGGVLEFGLEAKGLCGLEVPGGAAERRSSDMFELAPTTLYIPRFLPGTADMDFISEAL